MPTAFFHLHAELNDFLPRAQKGQPIRQDFQGSPAVKHLIEALGIPHTEVQSLTIHGQPALITDQITEDAVIEIFPPSKPVELGPNEPTPTFILDIHLGRLAAYLRMLGFDVLYEQNLEDAALALQSAAQNRILLTRDRRLLMRKAVERGYWVRSLEPEEQAVEVLRRFGLSERIHPFHRCLICNHPLEPVAKQEILHQLEPLTRQHFQEFHRCPACGQIYWKGSHYDRMQRLLNRLLQGLD
jgi:uncharacterized protein with PIN domain